MMSEQSLFKLLVAFYREYCDDQEFESISDLNLTISITDNIANTLHALNEQSRTEYGSILIQQIKVDGQNKILDEGEDFLSHIGETIEISFEAITLRGEFKWSLDDFLNYKNKIKEPELYFIAEINYASFDEQTTQEIHNYRQILRLINLLDVVCDHHQDINESGARLYYILRQNKLEIITNFSSEELRLSLPDLTSFLNEFLGDNLNTHLNERKQILQKVLFDSLSATHKKNQRFIDLIHHIEYVVTTYRSNFDLYINEFSFNKFIDEVAEKKLSFLESINSFVSSVGLKLISLPVVAVAAKVLSGQGGGIVEASTIFYSITMMAMLFFKADVIQSIETNIKKTFSKEKFSNMDFKYTDIQTELNDALVFLERRICVVKFLIFVFYVSAIALIFFVLCSKVF
jgi:hypothetical protein